MGRKNGFARPSRPQDDFNQIVFDVPAGEGQSFPRNVFAMRQSVSFRPVFPHDVFRIAIRTAH
jgi:hypothetical protein